MSPLVPDLEQILAETTALLAFARVNGFKSLAQRLEPLAAQAQTSAGAAGTEPSQPSSCA